MADGDVRAQEAFDLAAIAAALGRHKTVVEKRATREEWFFESRAGRGGQKRFYPKTTLPPDVRDALHRTAALRAAETISASAHYQAGVATARRLAITKTIDSAVEQRQRERGAIEAAGLDGKRKARMDAKLELVARLGAFAQARALGKCAAMVDFCAAYNSGELTVPLTVRQHTGADLCPRTLRRWRNTIQSQGPAALAGAYGNRAGTGALDTHPELRDFVIGLLADKPHISGKLVHVAIQTRFAHSDVPSLDLRSVQRWLKKWKTDNAEHFLAQTNPDQWKNRYMAGFGSLTDGITRANQLWQLDSSPADLQLVDGRYSLVGVIDLAWRGLRLHVTKTSTAEAVCQVMRRAILEWGVPEAVKMDNGRDYASDRVASLLAGLHIEPRFSAPFSPWEKGNIERAFRSFSHNLLELLPGYSGHNVAEAQAIRARTAFADRLFKKNEVIELKLTAAELQQFCDQWCEAYYAHEEHEGLNGITPFQRYAELRDVVRRVGDVRALDLLLGEGEQRTVTKKGLRVDKLVYIAPELASVIGQPVLVRVDDADVGRAVVYHHEQFLCVAECPEVTGVSKREIAIESKARQTKQVQQAKAEMRAAKRKANTGDIAREILIHKAEQHAALSALPAPNVIHLTPALEAASIAADALDAQPAGRPDIAPTTIADVDDVTHLLRREQAQDDTAEQRFAWAIEVLMKAPEERDDIQRHRLKNYVNSDEFKGRWMVFEYFGPEAQGLAPETAALLPNGTERDRLLQAQQGN
ncbi:Mu transposase C-terminal domain-containing protein [Pseudoxanthomonas sp. UTMC 1351]|uniref:Mu transposase C-terminal domain-containing protein n=1 Tax=Pseudoxanthomonas sp. UTMC 1351 TaxID=2695853 RepID=UPI0034CD32F2